MPYQEFSLQTQGQGLYEITGHVRDFVSKGMNDGLLTVFARHTSCSLLIQENADPDVQTDLNRFFQRLVPSSNHPDQSWITHTMEGPDDMPAHIKAALTQTSIGIPVVQGRMVLGTWQGIYLFEHRDQSHSRSICLQFLRE